MIIRDTDILHPKVRDAVNRLAEDLIRSYEAGQTKSYFKVFETLRSPERQDELFIKGSSKARAWQSPHNFGLAADFVPYVTHQEALDLGDMLGEKVLTGWSWHADHDWPFLKSRAEKHGLAVPISWDRCHVEWSKWNDFRACVNRI